MTTRSTNILHVPGVTTETLVEQLGTPHRHKYALQRLMRLGGVALEAVRAGLRHDNPAVRIGCCKFLDHHMDDAALPALIENLSHPEPQVRIWSIHALACDRCKEGSCRPGEDDVIPHAAAMLRSDTNRKAREMAAGMLGPSVHRSRIARDAIAEAAESDPDPVVRKIAGWWIPGGSRFEKTRPA